MLLADPAFLDLVSCVLEYCRLIVSLSQDLSCQRSSSDVISAYALMYFSQHVFSVFSRDALKDGCEESSLVEASLVIGKPGRPRPYFSYFFRVVW